MADNMIRGPLGIWPFPILNALAQMSGGGGGGNMQQNMPRQSQGQGVTIESYDVIRDDRGRIESVEIVRGIGNER